MSGEDSEPESESSDSVNDLAEVRLVKAYGYYQECIGESTLQQGQRKLFFSGQAIHQDSRLCVKHAKTFRPEATPTN